MNRRALPVIGLAGAIAIAGYLKSIRPRVLNWGATPQESNTSLPGDAILPEVALQTTRAITINARPSEIWPWLVQMGPKPRAGVYTYDWIERLLGIDIQNSDRILPEFQHLEAGESFALNEKTSLVVREVAPGSHLVLQWMPATSTWAFCLQPAADGTTRLLSRNRIPGGGPGFWLMMTGIMEWASLIMERKMLLGMKERAERFDASTAVPGEPESEPGSESVA